MQDAIGGTPELTMLVRTRCDGSDGHRGADRFVCLPIAICEQHFIKPMECASVQVLSVIVLRFLRTLDRPQKSMRTFSML